MGYIKILAQRRHGQFIDHNSSTLLCNRQAKIVDISNNEYHSHCIISYEITQITGTRNSIQ